MRRLLAGIFLLQFLVPAAGWAETTGSVESIGFGWNYRPNCHIPMLVSVLPDRSGTYQIRIYQEDMDRDVEIFTQTVSLTGAAEGATPVQQKFWLYFIPQPTEEGLSNLSLLDLQKRLRVFLCDEKGKQIIQLPVTQTIQSIDAAQAGPFTGTRGNKMILAVVDSGPPPLSQDYKYTIGSIEDVVFIPIQSTMLPEDVRGYEAIDGIVWCNAKPPGSDMSSAKRHDALRQYVRGGGHLVVCQPSQRDATANFDDILPVKVTDIKPKKDLEPLKGIARVAKARREQRDKELKSIPGDDTTSSDTMYGPGNDWDRDRGSFNFARAELKPDAIAEIMIDWDGTGKDRTPWLARHGVGAGAVSWVAQDLADPAIIGGVNGARSGWPLVWDRVLDYKSDLTFIDQRTEAREIDPYRPNAVVDVGHALLSGMELAAKTRALVSIAVVFFIAYWVVAGPGVYFYLLTKSRAHLSWFLFAVAALGATMFTVLVVKLVVRGAPELSHVTLVRAAANEPAICLSSFGLYIPRDGPQEISLPDIAPKEVSYLTAYPEHPLHAQNDIEFPAAEHYDVMLRDPGSDESCAITVPYRSTLKKFQARRVGNIAGSVQGSAKLHDAVSVMALDGVLSNGTGQKLRNVYFVFNDPRLNDDVLLFLPTWEKGQSFDLADFQDRNVKGIGLKNEASGVTGYTEEGVKLRDRLGNMGVGWARFWFAGYRNSGIGAATHDDLNDQVPTSFPMMSLFGRLPAMRNDDPRGTQNRSDILRRGGRYLDISAAVAAGKLVVLAEANGEQELPFTLNVEGDKVPGKGKIFYQFVLPLLHPAGTETPSTKPVEQPEAKPLAPLFDPTNYRGNGQELTPEQKAEWERFRRNPRGYRRRQAQPQPATPSSMKPLKSDDAVASGFRPEAATWPQ